MRKSMLLLILLVLPLLVGFEVMSDGGLVSGSDYSLKVLMLKESVMTPDVDLMDDGDGEVVIVEDESVALGSADSEIDFNFIEELKFEKLYIINLLY